MQGYWIHSGSCESRTYRLSSSRRQSKLLHLIISYSLPRRSSRCPQGQGPNPGPAAEGSRNTSLGHTAPPPVMAHTDSSGNVLAFFRGITNSTHSVGSKCSLRRSGKQIKQSQFLNSFWVSPVIRNSVKFIYCSSLSFIKDHKFILVHFFIMDLFHSSHLEMKYLGLLRCIQCY